MDKFGAITYDRGAFEEHGTHNFADFQEKVSKFEPEYVEAFGSGKQVQRSYPLVYAGASCIFADILLLKI